MERSVIQRLAGTTNVGEAQLPQLTILGRLPNVTSPLLREQFADHTLLFPQKEWQASIAASALRAQAHLTFPLEQSEHGYLHREVSKVPVPDNETLSRVNAFLLDAPLSPDPLEALRNLQKVIDRCSARAQTIDRKLALLSIEHLEIQKPYILRGMSRR